MNNVNGLTADDALESSRNPIRFCMKLYEAKGKTHGRLYIGLRSFSIPISLPLSLLSHLLQTNQFIFETLFFTALYTHF